MLNTLNVLTMARYLAVVVDQEETKVPNFNKYMKDILFDSSELENIIIGSHKDEDGDEVEILCLWGLYVAQKDEKVLFMDLRDWNNCETVADLVALSTMHLLDWQKIKKDEIHWKSTVSYIDETKWENNEVVQLIAEMTKCPLEDFLLVVNVVFLDENTK